MESISRSGGSQHNQQLREEMVPLAMVQGFLANLDPLYTTGVVSDLLQRKIEQRQYQEAKETWVTLRTIFPKVEVRQGESDLLVELATKGDLGGIQWAIEQGWDPNRPDSKGDFPLFAAVQAEQQAVFEYLAERCDPFVESDFWTEASPDSLYYLALYGLAMDRQGGSNGTELRQKVSEGSLEEVKRLLEGGAPVEQYSRGGWTALHFAADRGDEEIMAALLANTGHEVLNKRGSNGQTAIEIAAAAENWDCVGLLLQKGASCVAARFVGASLPPRSQNLDLFASVPSSPWSLIETVEDKWFGLRNETGNDCFINSALQVLYWCYDLEKMEGGLPNQITFRKAFKRLIKRESDSAKWVRELFRFSENGMEDPSELMLHIDRLFNFSNRGSWSLEYYIRTTCDPKSATQVGGDPTKFSAVGDNWILRGQREANWLLPISCDHVQESAGLQGLVDYSLEVEQPSERVKVVHQGRLYEASATKRVMIDRAPDTLALCLTRYSQDHGIKNGFQLSGETVWIGNSNFKVTAFITHYGESKNGGHYKAFVSTEGKWVEFDDSKVTPLDAFPYKDYGGAYIVILKKLSNEFSELVKRSELQEAAKRGVDFNRPSRVTHLLPLGEAKLERSSRALTFLETIPCDHALLTRYVEGLELIGKVKTNDAEGVRKWISECPELLFLYQPDGSTIFSLAVSSSQEVMAILLEAFKAHKTPSHMGFLDAGPLPPLEQALIWGKAGRAQQLIEAGASWRALLPDPKLESSIRQVLESQDEIIDPEDDPIESSQE
ncbi:MAG: ankyrin repeat domain-containing protein [Parachlamydiales bacterium]